MSIEKNSQYMEGEWAATQLLPKIDKTTYKTLEGAILVKQGLIDNFEKEFGFSREMEIPDSNYAWNLGMLDKFKKEHGISKEGRIQDSEELQRENQED